MWPDQHAIRTTCVLVSQFKNCQSPDFVISMSKNPSSKCYRCDLEQVTLTPLLNPPSLFPIDLACLGCP